MATEVAILPLQSGAQPEDPNSEAGQAWKKTLKMLSEQEGMQRNYAGKTIEEPEVYRLFVDWDTVDHHIRFTKKDIYKNFMDEAGVAFDGSKGSIYHVHFQPHPPQSVLCGPHVGATEIITMYFPTDYSEADRAETDTNFQKFLHIIKANDEKCRSTAAGWAVEKLNVPGTDEEATVYMGLLGWDSVEAHMAFRDTQAFKDNIYLSRKAKGLIKVTMVHAKCTETSLLV